jgi:hypothetical protein
MQRGSTDTARRVDRIFEIRIGLHASTREEESLADAELSVEPKHRGSATSSYDATSGRRRA